MILKAQRGFPLMLFFDVGVVVSFLYVCIYLHGNSARPQFFLTLFFLGGGSCN